MGEIYNAGDVVDKTLMAATRVPVYKFPGDSQKPYGYVSAGQPVGIVYSYLEPNPAQDRTTLWWVFSGMYDQRYYAPHKGGLYDVSALRQQGVVSVEEKIEDKELANLPWYEQLVRKYGPWIIGAALAGTALRGYLSRPRQ